MMIAVERHLFLEFVDNLIIWPGAGCREGKLYAIAVRVHLGRNGGDKVGSERLKLAIPTFGSGSSSQNAKFQKNGG